MSAARSWSSQKPGAPICCSRSVRRAASASGSKVITDPREAGSDLLELRFQRLCVFLGHALMLAEGWGRTVTVSVQKRHTPNTKGQTLVFDCAHSSATCAGLWARRHQETVTVCK